MYANTAAVLRGDILTVVEEAGQADQMFIGLDVFPVYESSVRVGQYPKFKAGSGKLLDNDIKGRRPGTAYPQIIRAWETDNYTCLDFGVSELVDDSTARDIARFFSAEVVAAKLCLRQLKLAHEVRVAAALMDATVFTKTAAAVAYTEANIATIAFHRDVLDAANRLAAKGIMPNAIIMNNNVFNRTRRSTLAQNYIRGAGKATDATLLLSKTDLASSLNDVGIQNIFVGSLSYNNKQDGSYSGTSIWGNTYIWVGRIEGGDFMAGGAGRTVVWNEEGGIWVAESYRDEEKRSDVIRTRHNVIEKVVDATAGELITTSYT